MAEHIPEGTKRRHGNISVVNADSDCGTGPRVSTASRASKRGVAISDDLEIRLGAD